MKQAIVPLGVGAYLASWGYSATSISEKDWWEHEDIGEGMSIHFVPARHYSGRLFKRSQTLWGGYVLDGPDYRLLLSGDTGFGPHFEQIHDRFGDFDLVALDQGQYDPRWPYIHMTPREALNAAERLQASQMLPAHVGKYTLAKHPWREPFERISQLAERSEVRLVTPMIGGAVVLSRQSSQAFEPWW